MPRFRVTRATTLATIAVATALATAGLVAFFGTRGEAQSPPTFGILERDRTPADRLPAAAVEHMARSASVGMVSDPGGERLAFEQAGRAYFVVQGDNETLCLVATDVESTVASCGVKSGLTDDPLLIFLPAGGKVDVFGLVRDGFESARVGAQSSNVRNNVFTLDALPAEGDPFLTLTGSAGTMTVDLKLEDLAGSGMTVTVTSGG